MLASAAVIRSRCDKELILPSVKFLPTSLQPRGPVGNDQSSMNLSSTTLQPRDLQEHTLHNLQPGKDLEKRQSLLTLQPREDLENRQLLVTLQPREYIEKRQSILTLQPREDLENRQSILTLQPQEDLENRQSIFTLQPREDLENRQSLLTLQPREDLEKEDSLHNLPREDLEKEHSLPTLQPRGDLENEHRSTKSVLTQTNPCLVIKRLTLRVKTLENKLKKANAKLRYIQSDKYLATKIEQTSVTPATAKQIVSGKRPKTYSNEDIAAGALLQAVSRKAFDIIRERGWMRLPTRRTIEGWLSEFKVVMGMQHQIIDLASNRHTEAAAKEIFLAFDEMSLKESWCYDKDNKQVLVPATKMQLVIARGIISGWKMPVFVASDTQMTLELLWSIVKSMEDKGFRVWGVCFDLGNKVFQKEIGLHQYKYKVLNPFSPDRNFYFCPDAPHALKRLRDHCFDKTFLVPKGIYDKMYAPPTARNVDYLLQCGDYVELGKKHFQEILNSDTGEFKVHWKLKPRHLDATQGNRCSVPVAAQTMSSSSAINMVYFRPDWITQSSFVQTVNDVSVFLVF